MVFSQNIPLPHSKNLSTRLNIPSWLKTSSSKKTSEEMASILIRSLKVTVNTFVLFVWLFDLQCDQSQVSVNVSRKVTYFQDPEWSYKSTLCGGADGKKCSLHQNSVSNSVTFRNCHLFYPKPRKSKLNPSQGKPR